MSWKYFTAFSLKEDREDWEEEGEEEKSKRQTRKEDIKKFISRFLNKNGKLKEDFRRVLREQNWVKAYGVGYPNKEVNHTHIMIITTADSLVEAQELFMKLFDCSCYGVVFKKASPASIKLCGAGLSTSAPGEEFDPEYCDAPCPGQKVFLKKADGIHNMSTISYYHPAPLGCHVAVTCYHALYSGEMVIHGWHDEERYLEIQRQLAEDAERANFSAQSARWVYNARSRRVGTVRGGLVRSQCDVGLISIPSNTLKENHILENYQVSLPPENNPAVFSHGETEQHLGRLVQRHFDYKSSLNDDLLFEDMNIIENEQGFDPPSSGCLVFHNKENGHHAFCLIQCMVKNYYQEFNYGNASDEEEKTDISFVVCQQLDTTNNAVREFLKLEEISPCLSGCGYCDQRGNNSLVPRAFPSIFGWPGIGPRSGHRILRFHWLVKYHSLRQMFGNYL